MRHSIAAQCCTSFWKHTNVLRFFLKTNTMCYVSFWKHTLEKSLTNATSALQSIAAQSKERWAKFTCENTQRIAGRGELFHCAECTNTSTEFYSTVEKHPFARRFERQVSGNKVPGVSLQAGMRLFGSPMSVIGGVRRGPGFKLEIFTNFTPLPPLVYILNFKWKQNNLFKCSKSIWSCLALFYDC